MVQIKLTDLNVNSSLSDLNAVEQKLVNGGLLDAGFSAQATISDKLTIEVTSTVGGKDVVLGSLSLSNVFDFTPDISADVKILNISNPVQLFR